MVLSNRSQTLTVLDPGVLNICKKKIISEFPSFLQTVEILPNGIKEDSSIPHCQIHYCWLHEESGHYQPCLWPTCISPETFWYQHRWVNSSLHGQNDRHFADDNFKCIFMNKNVCILIEISLNILPKGPTYNKPALVLMMAWRRVSDMLLSQPKLTRFTDA